MKEKIYTIPVTEAFQTDCECPLCLMEKKLEDEYINYVLGPSLMEPENRTESNEYGFCKKHFEMAYNSKKNVLGLGLILDTHLTYQNNELKKITEGKENIFYEESRTSMLKNLSNKVSTKLTESQKLASQLVDFLTALENKCCVCLKLNTTLERYLEVVFYLWKKEPEFRSLFDSKKGFCLKHYKELINCSNKYLNLSDAALFLSILVPMQNKHMERIQQEVNWFCKKFDYRNNDAPWGNSKDSVSRSIEKLSGFSDLKT
jgi:hypothetical protein